MNLEHDNKIRGRFVFIVLIPIFMVVSALSSKFVDARKMDFAAYWQAGHMILSGQDVYDSAEWIKERELRGTAPHSEPTFQYPLPLAILFVPLGLLPVQSAYSVWIFLSLTAISASILILLNFFPMRTGYMEILIIAGVFLFRPAFSVILFGQILSLLLFFTTISIFLFHREEWFWGGFILSILSMKPSIGLPILALAGMWLLSRKQWMGILGIASGGAALFLIGAIVNPGWVFDYVNIGGDAFSKYYGMHPTFWGAVDHLLVVNSRSLIVGSMVVLAIVGIEGYTFWRAENTHQPLAVFASILPAGLLIAPYSWGYDQIMLTVSLVHLVMKISALRGGRTAAFFLIGIVTLSILLVYVAHVVLHDVWSFLNSFIIWAASLYFAFHQEQIAK